MRLSLLDGHNTIRADWERRTCVGQQTYLGQYHEAKGKGYGDSQC